MDIPCFKPSRRPISWSKGGTVGFAGALPPSQKRATKRIGVAFVCLIMVMARFFFAQCNTVTTAQVDEMKKHMAKIAFKASSCSFQELLPPTAKVGEGYKETLQFCVSFSSLVAGAPWLVPPVRQVNLDAVRGMEKIKEKLKVQTEIAVNLDQDPHVQEHMGSDMPVLLASLSTMYALLRDRPFTALETWPIWRHIM